MNFEILMSCMNLDDFSIVQRSFINSSLLVVNQHNRNCVEEILYCGHKIRMLTTTERGLSRSRNMAIANAEGDICLLADDDEIFAENYSKKIIESFVANLHADIILFNLDRHDKLYPKKPFRVGYIDALRFCSCQIAFKRESIIKHDISFDVDMGSGSGNGGGEDTKFLFDCIRAGLNVIYIPIKIASVAQGKSNWFHGYTNAYFRQRGWTNRRIMGKLWALLYAFEFAIAKYWLYSKDNSFINALKFQISGIRCKKPPCKVLWK